MILVLLPRNMSGVGSQAFHETKEKGTAPAPQSTKVRTKQALYIKITL